MLSPAPVLAGPPYETDDPEPTEYRSYEIYVAAQYERRTDETLSALPLIEVNYGLFRNVQFSIDAPMSFIRQNDASAYGLGDLTLGLKVRFIQETRGRPQIAFYPLIVIPSGNPNLQVSSSRLFLPLWAQKSFGRWTIYGGGGMWAKSVASATNWWFTGLVLQYELPNKNTVGAEMIRSTPQSANEGGETAFNLGYVASVGKTHSALLSLGRGIVGSRTFAAYVAYRIQISK